MDNSHFIVSEEDWQAFENRPKNLEKLKELLDRTPPWDVPVPVSSTKLKVRFKISKNKLGPYYNVDYE